MMNRHSSCPSGKRVEGRGVVGCQDTILRRAADGYYNDTPVSCSAGMVSDEVSSKDRHLFGAQSVEARQVERLAEGQTQKSRLGPTSFYFRYFHPSKLVR